MGQEYIWWNTPSPVAITLQHMPNKTMSSLITPYACMRRILTTIFGSAMTFTGVYGNDVAMLVEAKHTYTRTWMSNHFQDAVHRWYVHDWWVLGNQFILCYVLSQLWFYTGSVIYWLPWDTRLEHTIESKMPGSALSTSQSQCLLHTHAVLACLYWTLCRPCISLLLPTVHFSGAYIFAVGKLSWDCIRFAECTYITHICMHGHGECGVCEKK